MFIAIENFTRNLPNVGADPLLAISQHPGFNCQYNGKFNYIKMKHQAYCTYQKVLVIFHIFSIVKNLCIYPIHWKYWLEFWNWLGRWWLVSFKKTCQIRAGGNAFYILSGCALLQVK